MNRGFTVYTFRPVKTRDVMTEGVTVTQIILGELINLDPVLMPHGAVLTVAAGLQTSLVVSKCLCVKK
jgi:hypothetical protein